MLHQEAFDYLSQFTKILSRKFRLKRHLEWYLISLFQVVYHDISLFFSHVSDDTNDKMIPLQWAIQRTEKDLSIFLAVLAETSDINYQDSMGNTSLHYLVKRRPQYSNIMVQQIYKKGASDIENNEGKSAYDTAHDLEYVQMKEFVR